jgi:hypothetical protein
LQSLALQLPHPEVDNNALKLNYNPDSTLWFLPVDSAVHLFWNLMEDHYRPRICNLVSAQATLNREWLQFLSRALGYESCSVSETANAHLPSILKQMLTDNVLVKTRNLFEVSGRYHEPPTQFDTNYFRRLLDHGKRRNWGRRAAPDRKLDQLAFSAGLAQYYFEEFLPLHFTPQLLDEFSKLDTSVGFVVEGPQQLCWVMRLSEGQAVVERLDHGGIRPKISICFSSDTMIRLILRKDTFEKALIKREAKLEGPLLDGIKAGNIFSKFLKDHPYNPPAQTAADNN